MAYRVDIQRVDLHAMFDIRGDEAGMRALLKSQELPFPDSPNQWKQVDDKSVLRVGPMRCLCLTSIDREQELETALRTASNLSYVNATRISDMYTALMLEGDDVFDVISQVTPLDIRSLGIGSATATDLFSTAGFVFRHDDQRYSLYFESSYFDYAYERLQKCALLS